MSGKLQHRVIILSISTTAAPILLIFLLLLCSSLTAATTSADSPTTTFYGKDRSTRPVHPGIKLATSSTGARRWLIGSSPPTCRSKCGRCRPCVAVDVPIQPGVSVPLEYYPEAWRCKCGNKLYMP